MMPRASFRALCKALAVVTWVALASSHVLALEALVTVDGGSRRGQAGLFTRGDACFALTPRHVLGGKQYAVLSIPLGSQGVRSAQGDLCAEWTDVDLSLLRVSGHAADGCGAPLATATPVERLLPASGAGVLRYSNQDGSTERVEVLVTFRGQEYLVGVRPRGSQDPLTQGLSGSTLYLSDLPAGLLLAAGDESDEGTVLRLDYIVGLLNALFDKQQGAFIRDSSCLVAETLPTSTTEGVGIDYAAAANGGQVVQWIVPPVSSMHRPEMLIGPPDDRSYWAIETRTSAFVVVRFAAIRTISRIEVDLSQVPPGERPGSLSVLTRGSPTGPWTQVAGVHVQDADQHRTLAFAARRVLEIRVEITPKTYGPHVIGLGRISAYD